MVSIKNVTRLRSDDEAKKMYRLTVECPCCGKESTLDVKPSGYFALLHGAHVQEAFPEMKPWDREKLISGMCSKCQEMIFGMCGEDE